MKEEFGGTRRRILKAVGSSVTLSATGAFGTVTAQKSSGTGPVRAGGTILDEYTFSQDKVVYEEWYVSPDLKERYGTPRIRFKQKEFDRSNLEEAGGETFPTEGKRVTQHKLDKFVGTESEWRNYYSSRKAVQDNGVSTKSKSDYTGPIFEYKQSDSGQYSLAAPVNIVFETGAGTTLSDIAEEMIIMSSEGDPTWNHPTCASDRYIFEEAGTGGSFVKQDTQLSTSATVCGDQQDHIRFWADDAGSFGGTTGQFEIGSIHHDPYTHSCSGGTFTFEPPEQRFKDFWDSRSNASVSSIYLGNEKSDWEGCKESNDGYAGYINW